MITRDEKKIFSCLGASNHSKVNRAEYDYYATPPSAVEDLLNVETFNNNILEPACGGGSISNSLLSHGYNITSSDLIDRGFGEVKDFFEIKNWQGDIVTNPPYNIAKDFVNHALSIIPIGNKVAMLLKITFLESKSRGELFKQNPPIRIYVYSERIACAINGNFDKAKSSAICYAWFIWEKGYSGSPSIHWLRG